MKEFPCFTNLKDLGSKFYFPVVDEVYTTMSKIPVK